MQANRLIRPLLHTSRLSDSALFVLYLRNSFQALFFPAPGKTPLCFPVIRMAVGNLKAETQARFTSVWQREPSCFLPYDHISLFLQ